MNYKNTEIKIDQMVGYLNEEKVNLSPAFQRGHVWTLMMRQKLVQNIVAGKPIPAIFLYKEESGTRYSYNILDGKQRLESLILYIGNSGPQKGLSIGNWSRYFVEKHDRRHIDFKVKYDNLKYEFSELPDSVVRDLREYAIPTVEIQLDEQTNLDEIINLFVDINQQGVQVNRFDIVKALYRQHKLLKKVFKLISIEQKRGQDVYYKMVNNDITYVLKKLKAVSSMSDNNSKVDRMWERLLEIVLYAHTHTHRKPVDILKGFINRKNIPDITMDRPLERKIRTLFEILTEAYKAHGLQDMRIATDQTHFYTMITGIIAGDFINTMDRTTIIDAIDKFAKIIGDHALVARRMQKDYKEYMALSEKQTTDSSKRADREKLFLKMFAN